MKIRKTALTLILMTVLTVTACAQQYDPESDFKAKPIDGGKGVEITEYVGSKWEVRIPPKIQGLPVTHIRGFSRKSLISVTIPNSVTTIGDSAFSVNQLTKVIIPNSVTHIGQGAFYYNKQLTSITIGSGVTNIGIEAFGDCDNLTTINVDSGNVAYSSQDGVLYNKNKTTLVAYPKGKTAVSFTIPNSVTSIEDYAFENCTNLTNVIIPNTVTSIGERAFHGCTGITGRFLEVLKPLADTMSKFESVPAQERRDQYDSILPEALTSQPTIYRIFSIWKPNTIDGMDSRNIERTGSTPRGQYAPIFAKENGSIDKSTFTDVNDSMAYITGPNALIERLKPMRFKMNGQDVWILRIELPIINHRLMEVVGTVGGYCDIR